MILSNELNEENYYVLKNLDANSKANVNLEKDALNFTDIFNAEEENNLNSNLIKGLKHIIFLEAKAYDIFNLSYDLTFYYTSIANLISLIELFLKDMYFNKHFAKEYYIHQINNVSFYIGVSNQDIIKYLYYFGPRTLEDLQKNVTKDFIFEN